MWGSAMVIGVGNRYRQDDAVGPSVIDRLRERGTPPGVLLALCDGEPSRLIELWSQRDLAIAVDALSVPSPEVGAVHRLEVDAVADAREPSSSSHGLGMGTAVRLARELDRMPGRLIVYAVEVGGWDYGLGMSAPVRAAASHVADHIAVDLAEFAAAEHAMS